MLAQTRVIKIMIIMIRVSKKDQAMEANEYEFAISYSVNIMYFPKYFYLII